jgi:hypothetical protein
MDEQFFMVVQIIKNLRPITKEKMSKVHDVCSLETI